MDLIAPSPEVSLVEKRLSGGNQRRSALKQLSEESPAMAKKLLMLMSGLISWHPTSAGCF